MLPAGCIQDHVSKVATCLQSLFGHFCINFAKWSGAFIGLNWAEIESNLCQEISILSVCFDFPTDVVKKICYHQKQDISVSNSNIHKGS